MDAPFKGKPKELITEQAERFYVSLGFPHLPRSFWEKSDLYPADPKSGRKKNSHASAWHINLADDVRSLMSIEPDSRWFGTAHHELGHIYYYISYSTPAVPYLLRAGANRAFHEAIGDLIGLAAGQRPYLKQVGLLSPGAEKADAVTFLLDTALDGSSVVFLPWSAGVMTRFEHDFYAGKIDDASLNAAWWALVGQYQGIAPPGERPETLCDAATKTHINDDRGAVLRLRDRHGDQVPAPRPHRAGDPQAGPARVQLLRQQAGRRLPPGHPRPGRDEGLERRAPRGDRRGALGPRAGRLLRAPDRMAGAGEPGASRRVELRGWQSALVGWVKPTESQAWTRRVSPTLHAPRDDSAPPSVRARGGPARRRPRPSSP